MTKKRTLNMYRQTKDSHYEISNSIKKDKASLVLESYLSNVKNEINKDNYTDFVSYLKSNNYKIVT
jgi:hypothetical protein|tara:strand:+ start:580 stop:777 length:198 start_codon:yes stop_codon:yes gene_type:complete